MNQQKQQLYDSSIKAILQEDAPGIVALLLEGARLEEALTSKVLRPPFVPTAPTRSVLKGVSIFCSKNKRKAIPGWPTASQE